MGVKVLIWILRLIMQKFVKKKRKSQKKVSVEKDLNLIAEKEIGKKTNKSNLGAQSSDNKGPDTSSKNKKLNNSDSIDKDTQSSISNKNSRTKIRERLKDKEEKDVCKKVGKVSDKS